MKYTDKPDAEYVRFFAEDQRTAYSRQSQLDDAMLAYMMAKNPQTVAQPNVSSTPAREQGFRSGIGGIIVKEDAALLTSTPGLHVNVVSEAEKDKAQASLLEGWLAGAWKLSQQAGQVWFRLPKDLRGVGRAWSNVYPNPKMWGSSRYERLLEAMQKASDDPASQEYKDAVAAVQGFKADNWPIRWKYVGPRQTWTVFNGETWLPEVVEIRKMTKKQIEIEYPDKIPAEYSKATASAEIDVYEYANWEWCAVVISGNEPSLATSYEHSLGINPYILCEAELLPENDNGWRWAGALFYAQNMIDVFDELMAEYRANIKDNTRTPLGVFYDRESYDEDLKVAGRPKDIKIEPGKTYSFWRDEDVKPIGLPQLNPEALTLLNLVQNLIFTTQIRPIEQGEAKSGTSQNQFVTAVQIAEREFDPSVKAMTEAAEGFAKRAFRAVKTLDEEVSVLKGVAIGPKDCEGMESSVQARMSRAIPIDRNLVLNQMLLEQNIGISRETSWEQTGGYENVQAEVRKSRRQQMADAMFQQVIVPRAIAWAQGQSLAPTQGELGQIQQQLSFASPGLQQAAMTAVPPEFLQAQANIRRTGVPQAPQQPGQPVIPGSTNGIQ